MGPFHFYYVVKSIYYTEYALHVCPQVKVTNNPLLFSCFPNCSEAAQEDHRPHGNMMKHGKKQS